MNRFQAQLASLLWTAGVVGLSVAAGFAQPPDPASKEPAWRPPDAGAVQAEVLRWLHQRRPDAAVRAKAAGIWSAKSDRPEGIELLNRVAATIALADENARKLVEICSIPRAGKTPPPQPWLADAKTPPLVANNLRLWYGRWLVHESLHDEALEQLTGLKPEDVVDPATLLFYQGIVHHRLLGREPGLEAVGRLLDNAAESPRRYVTLARLMEVDLKDLKADTLDHIARRMEDIERRLNLGRAGPKVRSVEDGVIKSLDKLIEDLESQQQQQAGAGGGNLQPRSPAQDSVPMGGKGRGEVAQKNVGRKSGWGNLPPREREEAMQQIGRQFPAHYRDVIEQYFRKLASEGSE